MTGNAEAAAVAEGDDALESGRGIGVEREIEWLDVASRVRNK